MAASLWLCGAMASLAATPACAGGYLAVQYVSPAYTARPSPNSPAYGPPPPVAYTSPSLPYPAPSVVYPPPSVVYPAPSIVYPPIGVRAPVAAVLPPGYHYGPPPGSGGRWRR